MGLAFEEATYSAKGAPNSPNVSENCKYGEKGRSRPQDSLRIYRPLVSRWGRGESVTQSNKETSSICGNPLRSIEWG
jgi:hypothetical protein